MLGIVSDSHIPSRADTFPDQFREKLEEADQVIHCGDFDRESFYDRFRDWFPDATCVSGNCDFLGLPSSVSIELDGLRIGVYHGSGIQPRGHHPTLASIATDKLDVDVLLHGHTHQSEAVRHEGVILINPGSCTGVGGGTATASGPTMRTISLDEGCMTKEWTLKDGTLTVIDETGFEV